MKLKLLPWAIVPIIALTLSFIRPDEGQYPVNTISSINLKAVGINLKANEIFNETGGAVSDALVRLGGCTGSFISKEGMIITNHHCVFGSVSRLSTPTDNYLRDGFYAAENEKELHTGLPAKITISSKDVSDEVLNGVKSLVGTERDQKLSINIKSIVMAARLKDSLFTYEVSEMFKGKQYFLFKYLTLLDVRLVYVPPRYIGEFGAETDNWEWPRHTGDFSVVRAYVGKDGKPAKYNKDNVPFNPKRHLKINPNGTKENDAVFILGYPGRTYRHQPAAFVDHQYKHFMPEVVDWFNWRIDKMHELSKGDEGRYLRFAGTIKGLANTEKNFRGKIQGLTRTDVLKQKENQDKEMAQLASNAANKAIYGDVIEDISTNYGRKNANFSLDFYVGRMLRDVPFMAAAMHAYIQKTEKKDYVYNRFTSFYRLHDHDLNLASFQFLARKINDLYAPTHFGKRPLTEMSDDKFKKCYKKSRFSDYLNKVKPAAVAKKASLIDKKDAMYQFCEELYPLYQELIKRQAAFKEKNDLLMPLYTELKMQHLKSNFVPDANSTLRFTYGRVKGFSPNDGEYHYPHTSLEGILEKANSREDYFMPQDAMDIYRRDNVAKSLLDPKTGKVTVGVLYNLDTTGGNSGSPILDANGDLVGVNFDRAYTATINDYAWNDKYSRSIGVDIRYVLYVMKYIGKADRILDELEIKL
jgi:hypothetical protein